MGNREEVALGEPITISMPTFGDRALEQIRGAGVEYYEPHPGQLAFHESSARERWVFGGSRSGKTECGAAELVLWIMGSQRYRPRKRTKGGTVWVVSESSEIQREVTQPKILKWLPKSMIAKTQMMQRGVIDFMDTTNGWHIMFKNYEQDVDKFGGKDVDFVWLDEQPPHDIYIECMIRTIDRGGVIVGTMTPVKGMSWIFNEIWEKTGQRGVETFMMDMDTNPYLNKVERDVILAGLTDQERKVRKEGKFMQLQGLIYPSFSEAKIVREAFTIPDDWRKVCAVDMHLAKQASILWAAMANHDYKYVKRGDWVFYRELRTEGMISDVVARTMLANNKDKLFARYGDPALNLIDNTVGDNPFDLFSEAGFPLIPANKKVEAGIYAIREKLDAVPSGMWIFDTLVTLIWEFKHYSFADVQSETKNYSEKVRKRDDDMIDNARYIVNSGITPVKYGVRTEDRYVRNKTGRIIGVANV